VGKQAPLVSVIVPVRNGAGTLRLVIDGLLQQSYPNLQILVSDNASTDATEHICREAVARDSRVSYLRHERPLTAIENFKSRVSDAQGTYVVFAAHDDLRDADFVLSLVAVAQYRSDVVCVVPGVSRFSRYTCDCFEVLDPVKEPVNHYSTEGLGIWQRLGFVVVNGFPCYGLIRRDALTAYPWLDIDYAPDMPLVLHLALYGEITVAEDATLFYWVPTEQKSPAERAVANSLKRLAPFPEVRLAWACGRAAASACQARGRRLPVVVAFTAAWLYRTTPWLRGAAYDLVPDWLRALWRRAKTRLGWRLN